ncbi:MAG: alpha/beta fold hydrolase BchO [Pseudomonadota bacterium]
MAMTTSNASPLYIPEGWPGRQMSTCVQASGVDWHVQQHGDIGPVIVLLHGAGASLHTWQRIWPSLSARHQVIVLDLPGHGFSTPLTGDYTLERTAVALDDLLKTMRVTPDVVLGHSAGGAIAMQWALDTRAAPKAVAAINPALLPFNGIAGLTFPVLARLMAITPMLSNIIAARARSRSGIERLITNTGSHIPDALLDGYHSLMQSPSHVKSVLSMMANWQLDDLLPRWRSGSVPLHVALGSLDRAVPPGRTQQALRDMPATHIHRWLSRGHLAHEESPDDVVAWLKEEGLCL